MKLFVYGTLKQSQGRAVHRLLGDNAVLVEGNAKVKGQLYHLGGFPGFKYGDGEVLGELYEIKDPDAWPRLDSYEGVPHLYTRESVVEQTTGEPTDIYVYQGDPHEEQRIANGVW
jgi:gamma-glutamylcyclotransferase (GGCT)/AIG2-like uncharacterized protein YtfP